MNYIYKVKYYYGNRAKEITMIAKDSNEVEQYILETEHNPNNVLDIVLIYDVECVSISEL